MTTPKPFTNPGASAYQPLSSVEKFEEDAALAGVVAADGLRVVEVVGAVFVGLLVCPPLAVLMFVFVVPLVVVAVILGLLAAVLSMPYLLVQHRRAHYGGHLPLLAHRLRHAALALIDLAPHRIAAEARKVAGR